MCEQKLNMFYYVHLIFFVVVVSFLHKFQKKNFAKSELRLVKRIVETNSNYIL